MPPNTCMGMCNKSCKNNCPLNKHIWMRDYREPPAELYLVIDLYKLTNYDIAYDESDIVVFLVNHSKFKDLKINVNRKKVLDFCGLLK